MRSQINLTNEQIEERFDEVFGDVVYAGKLVYTAELINDFLAARDDYAERGSVEINENGALSIVNAQAVKGQPRKSIFVLDFGSVRAVSVGNA